MRSTVLCFALLVFMCFDCRSQEDAVAKVLCPDRTAGSCVVIKRLEKAPYEQGGWIGIAASAHHVTSGHSKVKVVYNNGRSSTANVIGGDEDADVSILSVWVPDEIEPVKIGSVSHGEDVKILGYPFGGFEQRVGKYLHGLNGHHFSDIFVSPGFSGGGLFTAKGEYLGPISGGWFWLEGDGPKKTWPTKCGDWDAVKKLLDKYQGR